MLHHRHFPAGLTIIESMVALGLTVVIGGALWAFHNDVTNFNTLVQGTITGQQEMGRTFKTMTAEIRGLSPSALGAYPIESAQSTSFIFFSDPEKDGIKDRLRYFLDSGALKRGLINPTGSPAVYNPATEVITTIVQNVTNGDTPVFAYYDTNYDGTTPPLPQPANITMIRLVKITLIVDENSEQAPPPMTLTTQISMRNLKDNY